MTPLGPFPLAEAPTAPGTYTLLLRPEAARLAPTSLYPPSRDGFLPDPHEDGAASLAGTLASCTYHGREYRLTLQAASPSGPVALSFDLPAFQRAAAGTGLEPNRLPEPGEPVILLIYPGLVSLLKLA